MSRALVTISDHSLNILGINWNIYIVITSRIKIYDDVSLIKICVDESFVIKCEQYADAIFNRDFTLALTDFKKVDPRKFKDDHCIGKIAEIAAKQFIESHLQLTTNPIDYTIRSLAEVKAIGHDADLTADGMRVHVKSCRVLSPWPESYCFSNFDDAMSNPTAEDYLCAVRVDYRGPEYTVAKIRALVPLQLIQQKDLFKMPQKSTQKSLTRFVYAEDLLNEKANNA